MRAEQMPTSPEKALPLDMPEVLRQRIMDAPFGTSLESLIEEWTQEQVNLLCAGSSERSVQILAKHIAFALGPVEMLQQFVSIGPKGEPLVEYFKKANLLWWRNKDRAITNMYTFFVEEYLKDPKKLEAIVPKEPALDDNLDTHG